MLRLRSYTKPSSGAGRRATSTLTDCTTLREHAWHRKQRRGAGPRRRPRRTPCATFFFPSRRSSCAVARLSSSCGREAGPGAQPPLLLVVNGGARAPEVLVASCRRSRSRLSMCASSDTAWCTTAASNWPAISLLDPLMGSVDRRRPARGADARTCEGMSYITTNIGLPRRLQMLVPMVLRTLCFSCSRVVVSPEEELAGILRQPRSVRLRGGPAGAKTCPHCTSARRCCAQRAQHHRGPRTRRSRTPRSAWTGDRRSRRRRRSCILRHVATRTSSCSASTRRRSHPRNMILQNAVEAAPSTRERPSTQVVVGASRGQNDRASSCIGAAEARRAGGVDGAPSARRRRCCAGAERVKLQLDAAHGSRSMVDESARSTHSLCMAVTVSRRIMFRRRRAPSSTCPPAATPAAR